MGIINWALLREPVNWLVVWTMLLILWLLVEAVSRLPVADATLVDN